MISALWIRGSPWHTVNAAFALWGLDGGSPQRLGGPVYVVSSRLGGLKAHLFIQSVACCGSIAPLTDLVKRFRNSLKLYVMLHVICMYKKMITSSECVTLCVPPLRYHSFAWNWILHHVCDILGDTHICCGHSEQRAGFLLPSTEKWELKQHNRSCEEDHKPIQPIPRHAETMWLEELKETRDWRFKAV